MKLGVYVGRGLAALFVLALVGGVYLTTLAPSAPAPPGSVESYEPGGRRALFMVIEALGYEPRSWRGAPLGLPDGGAQLWISGPALSLDGILGDDGKDDGKGEGDGEPGAPRPGEDPSLRDPRHPWNYAEFARRGGTLVAPVEATTLEWLREDVGLEVPTWCGEEAERRELRALELDSGERLEVELEGLPLEARCLGESWRELVVDANGDGFAASCRLGRGRVVLLATDDFLSNRGLRKAEHALLAVRLVEALDQGGPLLFDEFALGRWRPPSTFGLLTAPGLREVSWHILALALGVLVFASWTREFPRDPDPIPMNPRLRAKAVARLHERAGRLGELGRELSLGVLRRVARRWRMAGLTRALGEGADEQQIADVARELVLRARGDLDAAEAWARELGATAPDTNRGLIELEARLARFEDELDPHRG